MLVPDSGVLLLGDCWYPPPAHLRSPADGPDLAMAHGLLDEDVEWYVSGHDEPLTRADARAALAG